MAEGDLPTRVYKAVGARIAALRRTVGSRKITQDELAKRTATLTRSAIANIERGRQRVAVHHLYLIARALGTSLEALLPPMNDVLGQPDTSVTSPTLKKLVAAYSQGKEGKDDATAKKD